MQRREFIVLLGGAAAWPLAARAQQSERVRRIAVLLPGRDDNQESRHRFAVFRGRLKELGWAEDHNIRFDIRWFGGKPREVAQTLIAELLALAPDLVFANGATVLSILQHRRGQCRLYSCRSSIRSPVGSSQAWPNRAAT